jgi:hypothetical protein
VSSLLQAACCCNQCINCACLPSSVTIDCPSFVATLVGDTCSSCGGGGSGDPTIAAATVTAYLCCSNTNYAWYRANPIKVEDVSWCCSGVCTDFDIWVLYYVYASCTDEGSGPVFNGWYVGAEIVIAQEDPCDQCATVTPRDIAASPCAGSAEFTNEPIESWFTCTSTCTNPGCVVTRASVLNTTGGSDSCDPTGTYAAEYSGSSIGNIVVS